MDYDYIINLETKEKQYNINFNMPITLQGFDKDGLAKVVKLNKKHIEYLVECEYKDTINDFVNRFNKGE